MNLNEYIFPFLLKYFDEGELVVLHSVQMRSKVYIHGDNSNQPKFLTKSPGDEIAPSFALSIKTFLILKRFHWSSHATSNVFNNKSQKT